MLCRGNLHINVVSALGEVAVQHSCQVPGTLILTATPQHLQAQQTKGLVSPAQVTDTMTRVAAVPYCERTKQSGACRQGIDKTYGTSFTAQPCMKAYKRKTKLAYTPPTTRKH